MKGGKKKEKKWSEDRQGRKENNKAGCNRYIEGRRQGNIKCNKAAKIRGSSTQVVISCIF